MSYHQDITTPMERNCLITTQACNDIIDSVVNAEKIDDIHLILSEISDAFGYEQFMYGALLPTSFVQPQLFTISGYHREWWDYYLDKKFLKYDPILKYCTQSTLPLYWHEIDPKDMEDPHAREVMREALEFGLNSGVSFSMYSFSGEFALLSFSTADEWAKAKPRMKLCAPNLFFLSHHIHEAVMRILSQSDPDKDAHRIELTAREKECLLWAAEGKTTWEVSQILKISERTVRFHLDNAARKLNVSSRQHSVAKAVRLGLIDLQLG